MNEEGIILPHHALPQSSHVGLPAPGFAPVPSQVSQTLRVAEAVGLGGGAVGSFVNMGMSVFVFFN